MPGAAEGIRLALVSGVYDTSPTWVRIDDPNSVVHNVVTGFETHRGRQYELDKTQAGTAVISVFDQAGIFDPTNTSGPYYGHINPLKQTKINVRNPCDGSYHDIYTGFTESWEYVLDQTERWFTTTINCVDGFELLSRSETVPDSTGTTTYEADQVDDRIKAALADYNSGVNNGSQPPPGAGWPSAWTNIFTGNVHMQATIYNPQSSILGVIQDAADAEFPNVANVFMDKFGNVAFRGRWSRFNPTNYSADPPTPSRPIRFWSVGDRQAAETFGSVPAADIKWNLDLKNVINAVLCSPNGIADGDIAAQLVTKAASIATYGVRSLSIPDLLVLDSIAGPVGPPFPATQPGGDGVGKPSADGNSECVIFGQYYVDNYSTPVEMISEITFQTIAPTDSLGPAWWKFVTGVEIGDVVTVTQSNPGGGGFKASQFFVEGIHNVVQVGSGDYPQWTMNLDLTPRNWYAMFDGVTYFVP